MVLFAVKLWDTEKAAEQMKPLIGPDTRVITLQNGVDSYERIAPIIGAEHAIPGVTYVVSVIDRPGVIKQVGPFQQIVCGTHDGRPDAKLAAFVDAAKAAGIDAVLSDDIQRDRWRKFIFLTGTSGATAVTRSTLGPILKDPDMRAHVPQHHERDAGRRPRQGRRCRSRLHRRAHGLRRRQRAGDMKASMANDLDRGNRLELDWLAGKVSQLGKELNVPTPVNDTIYAALKRYRMGKPG